MKFAFALVATMFLTPKQPVIELPPEPEPMQKCAYPDIVPYCPFSDSGPVCVADSSTTPCTLFCYCP